MRCRRTRSMPALATNAGSAKGRNCARRRCPPSPCGAPVQAQDLAARLLG